MLLRMLLVGPVYKLTKSKFIPKDNCPLNGQLRIRVGSYEVNFSWMFTKF